MEQVQTWLSVGAGAVEQVWTEVSTLGPAASSWQSLGVPAL